MNWPGVTFARLRALFRRNKLEHELDDEVRFHLEAQIDDNIACGMSPAEARYAALRSFGAVEPMKESYRDRRGIGMIETTVQDIRYAARTLRNSPGFAVACIATLALAIGANTAIFSVCDAVLFKPLPYTDPDRLYTLWETKPGSEPGSVAPGNYLDWRTQSQSFSDIATLYPFRSFILTGYGETARLAGAGVSSNFFRLLGVEMTLGRAFLEEEDSPDKGRVVVLTHSTWQNRFGGRKDILGQRLILSDNAYTVVGVLPVDFKFVSRAADFGNGDQAFDLWVPLAFTDREKGQRGTHPLRVFARLKPGVSPGEAQAELDVIGANLARQYPDSNKDEGIMAIPLGQQVTGDFRTALTTLLCAVGLVLLIACANVANLLLSRAAAREREIAVRLALGASRGRLARQLLTESVLLSLIGGALGLVLAAVALKTLAPLLPADLPRLSEIAVDMRVFLFTAFVSIATGILFGLAPLFRSNKTTAGESLKQSGRVTGGIHQGLRSVLAVTQVAVALILLTGAGLMLKSFWSLLHVSPGFRTEHVLTSRVSLPKSRYPDARRISEFQRDLLERVRSAPGIQSAGITAYLPFSGTDNAWAFTIDGRPPLPPGEYVMAKYRVASTRYFSTIGIPLLRGRDFTDADTADAPFVVIINESMARAHWLGENPVGQRLKFGSDIWRTVIGVVGDVHHENLDGEAKPEMYVPFSQSPNRESRSIVVMRTAVDPGAATSALREAVSSIDTALPIDQVSTMEQLVSASVGQPRFRTVLLGAFALLALVMASIGIYGVLNYLVAQRTREFGIRIAIGATEGDVLRLVLGRAAVLVGVGLAVGILGSASLAKLISGLLYGVDALDPLTFAVVPLLLAAVALLASYIPARRAMRVEPITALRQD